MNRDTSYPDLKSSKNDTHKLSPKPSFLDLFLKFLSVVIVTSSLSFFLSCQSNDDQETPPKPQTEKDKILASTEVENQIQYLLTKNVRGQAELFKPHKQTWVQLKVGQKIKAGFIVRTLHDAEVKLQFKDGSTILVKQNSEASLEEIAVSSRARKAELYLADGRILFNIKKLTHSKTHIAFTTPTATAAIRGTKGGVSTNGKSSLAYLEHGKLEVRGHNEKKSAFIGPLEYLKQTSQGFKVQKALSLTRLKKKFKIQEDWMKRLKKPVISDFYSPSQSKKYFQNKLQQKLGGNSLKFVEKVLNTNSLHKDLPKAIKNSSPKKIKDEFKKRTKKKLGKSLNKNLKQQQRKQKNKLKDAARKQLQGL